RGASEATSPGQFSVISGLAGGAGVCAPPRGTDTSNKVLASAASTTGARARAPLRHQVVINQIAQVPVDFTRSLPLIFQPQNGEHRHGHAEECVALREPVQRLADFCCGGLVARIADFVAASAGSPI